MLFGNCCIRQVDFLIDTETALRTRSVAQLDTIDRRIVEQLRSNARISNVKLAELIGISPAPCLRRVKELERKGVITGYVACVDRAVLGQSVMAFSEVQLKSTAAVAMDEFEAAVAKIPEVAKCFVTSGGWDYMLEIFAQDLDAFEHLTNRHLSQLPWVKRVRSRFALRDTINTQRRD